MKKTRPPLLKKGDKIGIVSPARFVEPHEIAPAIEWLKEKGYVPVLGKHIYKRDKQFAGKDKDRAADIADFLKDPEIKCIWSTRGGYGCIRLMPYLNEIDTLEQAKWIVGFSDITVIHSWMHQKFDLQSIHGPMLFSLNSSEESLENFSATEKLLSTGFADYQYNSCHINRGSGMSGILTGGNLSMLYSLRGTDLDLDVQDKILFLEDIDEYLYHIDRMMQNLKQAGWFNKISGLLVGGMNKMNDNDIPFGQSAEDIILSATEEYEFPVIFGHPSGHKEVNRPLLFGENIDLQIVKDQVYCQQ